MAGSPRTLGVLGSLCNPPHLGHLILAREAIDQLGLEEVLLVPTGIPSHRPAPPESPQVRLRLAHAEAAADPRIRASAIEVDRSGPSYMADTLELLRRSEQADLVLIIGADQYAALGDWHDPERVRRLARLAVAPRPGMGEVGIVTPDVVTIAMPAIDLSSSAIRERVRDGRSIRHLVPEGVRAVIEDEGLYRGSTGDR
jgi:nicotinate-nucleotide adenylyltransferase